uniref:Uncharacterized protein n=1 Tax=Schizaphis graminum TaxID=13262 RepID=A0A2S2P079_SCHGA
MDYVHDPGTVVFICILDIFHLFRHFSPETSYSLSSISSSSSKVLISIELSVDSFEPGLRRPMSVVPIDSLDEENTTSKLCEHMQLLTSHVVYCSSSSSQAVVDHVGSNGIMAAIMFSGPIASACPTEMLLPYGSFSVSSILPVPVGSFVGSVQYEHRWSLHRVTATSVTTAAAADRSKYCKYWQRNTSSPT